MRYQKGSVRKIEKVDNEEEHISDAILVDIYNAIQEIRYGSIQIHIQDGKIVQIDNNCKDNTQFII